jgi:hypothetical protein
MTNEEFTDVFQIPVPRRYAIACGIRAIEKAGSDLTDAEIEEEISKFDRADWKRVLRIFNSRIPEDFENHLRAISSEITLTGTNGDTTADGTVSIEGISFEKEPEQIDPSLKSSLTSLTPHERPVKKLSHRIQRQIQAFRSAFTVSRKRDTL